MQDVSPVLRSKPRPPRRAPALGAGKRWSRRALYVLAFGLLCYVAVLLAAGASAAERVKLLRYGALFGAGVLAVAAPHILWPDPQRPLMQLLNRPPPALLAHQLRQWGRVMALVAGPLAVLAFYDPGGFGSRLPAKSLHLVESLLVVLGTGCYALAHYATIGRRSQRWQEGHISPWYRHLKEHSATGGLGVPDGLVPAVTASGRIVGLAVLVVAAGAYAGRLLAPLLGWAPGALLLGGAGLRLSRLRETYDRHYYHTNAFYGEAFRESGGVGRSRRAALSYEAVYWAPRRLRPHVWAGLVQLDRRLPLGRFVAFGHLFLWILFFQNAASGAIAAFLLFFIAAQNAACFVLTMRPLAPPAFQVALQRPAAWAATRFCVNLRWTLPLLLSLLLVALFDEGFGYVQALLWTGLDVLMALAAAGLVTYFAEGQYRKQYA